MNQGSGAAVIVAALILGGSLLAGSFVLKSSHDRGYQGLQASLAELKTAMEASDRPAAPAAARRRGPDPNRRYTVETSGAPVRGSEDAEVTLVTFSDFQCPFCKRVTPTIEQIQKEYGDQVQVVWKHLPLSIHPKAQAAHEAAEAAHRQGKFWQMHDLMFEKTNWREAGPATYEQYAAELGLDVEKFRKDAASAEVKQRVQKDSQEAARLGVTGTPAFFVNGKFLSGAQPLESFKRVIDAELKG